MSKSDPGFMPATPSGAPLDVRKVQEQLTARRLGAKFHYFTEISSTNTHARELAERGAAEGEIVIGETQTHGRGRLGRHWESPSLVNLYLSIILRPKLAPKHAPQITLMAAVALVETFAPLIAQAPIIKWPNDILVAGRKVAGILTELYAELDRVNHVILGVGVNVNLTSSDFPPELRKVATSLQSESGKHVSRPDLAVQILRELEQDYGRLRAGDFVAVADEWEEHCTTIGHEIVIRAGDRRIRGVAESLGEDGALLLRTEHGHLERVMGGDVTVDR